MPTVSWMSICWAMTSLVPTPSVEDARIGLLYFFVSSRNRPAKPPRSPITSGRRVSLHLRLEQLDRALAGVDRDAGVGVRDRAFARRSGRRRPSRAGGRRRRRSGCFLRRCARTRASRFSPSWFSRAAPAAGRAAPVGATGGSRSRRPEWRRASRWCAGSGAASATRRPTPSSTCLPIRLSAGSSIGYSPSKHARHSRVFGCSVAAIRPAKRDVAQRVGADRAPDAVDVRARWRAARPGWRSRCRRSTAS